MVDDKRPGYNPNQNILEANTVDMENTNTGFKCDLLSNGFKFRGNESNVNGALLYLYAAFAKFPFLSSNNIPGVAR